MWVYPLLLSVPGIALCFTEHYTAAASVANAALPLGVYLLLCAWSRKVGRTVLLCTPLSIYAAFQIVLLFLYGESIIAVDMFLNVATTNVGEATELLANLGTAIFMVVVLYVPPIVWAIWLTVKHRAPQPKARRTARITGIGAAVAGLAGIGAAYATEPDYSVRRELFPVNVIDNTLHAVKRYHAAKRYPATSAAFRYDARSSRDAEEREVYVLVVGETCRADNWQLLGYDRATNPLLSRREGVLAFPKVLSESNTTHKSVPLMLSPLTAETFGDSIDCVRSVFEAFREAGYATAFFSNQQRNGSYIDFFGEQADTCRFIADEPHAVRSDSALVPMLQRFIAEASARKLFVVLHSYGSHFNYSERYSASHRRFTPDSNDNATRGNRPTLINAYDNTIVSTDAIVDGVIGTLASLPDSVAAAMLFVPDHGEDIFDDDRERFLHASPNPTYWQIHVPLVLWFSPGHSALHPEQARAARANAGKDVASSRTVFDTMLSLAGITTNHSRPFRALTDSTYSMEPRMYLNDYNEGVALERAGLHSEDFQMLAKKGISARRRKALHDSKLATIANQQWSKVFQKYFYIADF